MKRKLMVCAAVFWAAVPGVAAAEPPAAELSLEQFLESAVSCDTEFEQILIDELMLTYQKKLRLPARDLMVAVKHQHEFFFSQDRNSPDTEIELTTLFPDSATGVALGYQVGASLASERAAAELSLSLTQPVARNAFGRSTRLLDKLVGVETEVATHQIVEAYEDYLAQIMAVYYTWAADYRNVQIGRESYRQNLKLLDTMRERQEQQVALAIDVNKVKLQVLDKQEQLIEFEEQYKNSSQLINSILRRPADTAAIPREPDPPGRRPVDFEQAYREFSEHSRTFAVLALLERKSSLEVAREADDLLPSVDVIAGYQLSGQNYRIGRRENMVYAGVALQWPLANPVDTAEHAVAAIRENKQKLQIENTYYRLYTQLFGLYLQIEREQRLRDIAAERIELAEEILRDESENYSFGKITLNDYIQAFNTLDTNRFNRITHETRYRQLLLEWLRLSDQLVVRRDQRIQMRPE